MDVALISSLRAGCYDCPVMRAVACARHAGERAAQCSGHRSSQVQIPGRQFKTKGGSRCSALISGGRNLLLSKSHLMVWFSL